MAWRIVLILSATQFIMVLDTTVMNVAISDVVEDLDASVEQVQLAITLYMLVMASTMLIGGKFGDLIGRKRAFQIGLVTFALGSGLTAAAPNIAVLLIGWSFIEGIAAAILVPATAALVAGNYEGKQRAVAYGVLGGVAAAGAAAGPLIGGAVTSAASWRWVFAGEVAIAAVALIASRIIKEPEDSPENVKIDLPGGLLSITGLGLIVLAVQQAPSWGWIAPGNDPLTIGDTAITPLGLSPVPFAVALGLFALLAFVRRAELLEKTGAQPLVRASILKIGQLRAGLVSLFCTQVILLGTFFAIPLYLQVVLGKDAFETGVELIPLSALMFISALLAPRYADRIGPLKIVRVGLVALLLSTILIIGGIDRQLDGGLFSVGLGLMGIGAGLLVSQMGNVIMSSVSTGDSGEAGGLQGTFQNLGGALGTALVGAVLLGGLSSAFEDRVANNAAVGEQLRVQVAEAASAGVPFAPSAQVERLLDEGGAPADEAAAVVAAYEEAEVTALKVAILAVAFFVMLSFWFTRTLPRDPLAPAEAAAPV